MTEKKNSAYHTLALKIKAEILSGKMKPGDKLAGEPALAAEHGVSRTTIRLSIKELEKEGLVYRRQGAGTFVSALPKESRITRSSFSTYIKGLSGNISREVLDLRWMEAPDELAVNLKIPVGSALLSFKRLDCLNGKAMAYDEGLLFGAYAHKMGISDLAEIEFFENWQIKQGIRITKSVMEISAGAAGPEHSKLLGIKEEAPLLIEVSNCFTEDSGAARFKTFYRHDMYSFIKTYYFK